MSASVVDASFIKKTAADTPNAEEEASFFSKMTLGWSVCHIEQLAATPTILWHKRCRAKALECLGVLYTLLLLRLGTC